MKVLLVDDDRSTRYLLGRALTKRFGCEVTEAGDGRQALEALSRDHFQLAFLDVQMPVMDGLETLRTLRDAPEHAGLHVVMLTGERDEMIIREILELGVFEYMAKPLNMSRLADRLRRMLRTIIARRDDAPTEPGWFGQALRHIDAPLLIVEGRTPFRRCFAETFGAHRPVIEADSGVAGMREIVASNPGVVIIGDHLGVLSEPLLLRRIRSSPAGCHLPRVVLADDEEEADGRLLGYDGTLVRTLAPDTLLRRMADLMRLGGSSGWEAPELPPGCRATVLLVCEETFGTVLAAEMTLCDLPGVAPGERVTVSGNVVFSPGGPVRLELACEVGTGRRAATNLLGIDARMVQEENVDAAVGQVFELLRTRLAGIYRVTGESGTPEIQRSSRWNPLSGDEPGVTLCFQSPSREHEFWLTLRPIRTT